MRSRRSHINTVWFLAIVVCLLGCSSSGPPDRKAVYGMVTVDGKRVENGSISFLPARGTSGPAAASLIKEGRYAFSEHDGPYGGKHRVVIGVDIKNDAQPSTGVTTPADAKGAPVDERFLDSQREKQSKEENGVREPKTKWELNWEVPNDDKLEKNFELSERVHPD